MLSELYLRLIIFQLNYRCHFLSDSPKYFKDTFHDTYKIYAVKWMTNEHFSVLLTMIKNWWNEKDHSSKNQNENLLATFFYPSPLCFSHFTQALSVLETQKKIFFSHSFYRLDFKCIVKSFLWNESKVTMK